MHTASAPSTPVRQSLTRHLTGLDKREDEDMYRWMQRQQEFTRTSHHATGMQYYPSVGQESWTNTGISDLSQDDSLNTQRVAAMARPAFQLADAQVCFLSCDEMGIYSPGICLLIWISLIVGRRRNFIYWRLDQGLGQSSHSRNLGLQEILYIIQNAKNKMLK